MYKVTNVKGLLEVMKNIQGNRTQKEYADAIGVSAQYLNDVYNLRREPGPKILKSLGAQKAFLIPDYLIPTE